MYSKTFIPFFYLRRIGLFLLVLIIGNTKSLSAQEIKNDFLYSIIGQEMPINKAKDTARVWDAIKKFSLLLPQSPDSAVQYLPEALRISQSINFQDGIGTVLFCFGHYYLKKKDFRLSKYYYFKAIPYCKSIVYRPKDRILRLYHNLSYIYNRQGKLDSSLHFAYQALKEINKRNIKDTSLLLYIYGDISSALLKSETNDISLYYLNKALSIARAFKDTLSLTNCLTSIAVAYDHNNDTNAALQSLPYWEEAIGLSIHIKDKQVAQNIYYGIGRFYLKNNNLSKAYHYFKSAAQIDEKSANDNSSLQQGFGAYYYRIGRYKEAIGYYEKSLKICNRQGLLKAKIIPHEVLAAIYHKTNNNALAYANQKAYSDLKDSLDTDKKLQALNDLEVKYQLSEKDKQLTRQLLLLSQKENRLKQKNFWIGGIAVSSVLLLALLGSFYRNIRHKQKLQAEQIRNLEQEQEIEHLNLRMQGEAEERDRIARELHDGVNVLLSAAKMGYTTLGKEHNGLVETQSYKEVMHLLNEAGQEVRSVSYNLVPELLVRESLPAAIQAFCAMMERRHGLTINMQSFGPCPTTHDLSYTLYRMAQELIHNIVKHAEATEVLVQLLFHEKELQLIVEDNGRGFKKEEAITGMGLRSLELRVKKLQGQILLNSIPGTGTTVEIEIPLVGTDRNNPDNAGI